MRTGKMRHRGTLQKLGTRVDDGAGGGSIPFEDVVTVWASIEPLEGRELLLAGQNDARLTHRIRTRYYPGVRPSWRFKYRTRMFDIKTPINVEERNRELELMCEELLAW